MTSEQEAILVFLMPIETEAVCGFVKENNKTVLAVSHLFMKILISLNPTGKLIWDVTAALRKRDR